MLLTEGNVLASSNFEQSELDTPALDVAAGTWSTTGNANTKEEAKEEQKFGQIRDRSSSISKNFALVSNSCPKIHKEVRSMVIDQRRNYLYSAGGEKIIHCQDL